MPVQAQDSELLALLGSDLGGWNEEFKSKPVEIGFQRLPPGVKDGIAKITKMEILKQDKEGGVVPLGEHFFQVQAVAVYPFFQDGHKVATLSLKAKFIPCGGSPEKKWPDGRVTEAKTKKQCQWEIQNLIRAYNGDRSCPETRASDPRGVKTLAFWKSEMQRLTNPNNPTYFKFTTRSFTPPKPAGWKQGDPLPETKVTEEWLGLAEPEEVKKAINPDPAQRVVLNGSQPQPHHEPPAVGADGLPLARPGQAAPPAEPEEEEEEQEEIEPIEEKVARLLEVIAKGREKSPEVKEAKEQLEQMAWANGWTENHTVKAEDWPDIGEMCLREPTEEELEQYKKEEEESETQEVEVGSKWKFARRGRDGSKLKDAKKKEFPSKEIEVISIDGDTCHAKYVSDGKTVMDLTAKPPKPLDIKLEWLEE